MFVLKLFLLLLFKMVLCKQVNLGKSRQASLLLSGLLADDPAIAFVQEPYTVENKVVLRPAGYKVVPAATCVGVPRAALLIPSNIQAVTLGHLCNPDCSVAQIRWDSLDILIASVYLDSDDDVDQPWLTEVVDYAADRNMALVLCMDSNAHSSMYSEAESDERGGVLEDFILMHDLEIGNIGHVPTFQTFRAQSVIDVTLIRNIGLRGWHVDATYNASDHNTIVFSIKAEEVLPREIRRWKDAKWDKFSEKLKKKYVFP